jgi:hypothetical protein
MYKYDTHFGRTHGTQQCFFPKYSNVTDQNYKSGTKDQIMYPVRKDQIMNPVDRFEGPIYQSGSKL